MWAVVFIGFMVAILLIMAVFLFFGKGSFLIAGYNTASKEEKEKFDEKKLCRLTSVTCFVVAAMLALMGYLGYMVESGSMKEAVMTPFAIVFIIVIFATVFIDMFFMNTKCKKKDYDDNDDDI